MKRLHAAGICDCCDAPPVCETCDGDGYVDIVDDMGGVVGPAPCPNCSSADPFEAGGFTVLGRCIHGVDLDREFCPQGCRV